MIQKLIKRFKTKIKYVYCERCSKKLIKNVEVEYYYIKGYNNSYNFEICQDCRDEAVNILIDFYDKHEEIEAALKLHVLYLSKSIHIDNIDKYIDSLMIHSNYSQKDILSEKGFKLVKK